MHGCSNPYQVVYRKQYYRMITSGFLHADYVHLIFNMITLYFFGDAVEYYFNELTNYGTLLYVGLIPLSHCNFRYSKPD